MLPGVGAAGEFPPSRLRRRASATVPASSSSRRRRPPDHAPRSIQAYPLGHHGTGMPPPPISFRPLTPGGVGVAFTDAFAAEAKAISVAASGGPLTSETGGRSVDTALGSGND